MKESKFEISKVYTIR